MVPGEIDTERECLPVTGSQSVVPQGPNVDSQSTLQFLSCGGGQTSPPPSGGVNPLLMERDCLPVALSQTDKNQNSERMEQM